MKNHKSSQKSLNSQNSPPLKTPSSVQNYHEINQNWNIPNSISLEANITFRSSLLKSLKAFFNLVTSGWHKSSLILLNVAHEVGIWSILYLDLRFSKSSKARFSAAFFRSCSRSNSRSFSFSRSLSRSLDPPRRRLPRSRLRLRDLRRSRSL